LHRRQNSESAQEVISARPELTVKPLKTDEKGETPFSLFAS
jgi:hypothetical protein